MPRSAEGLLLKPQDPSSVPKTNEKAKNATRSAHTPAPGKKKEGDLWGALACQPSLLDLGNTTHMHTNAHIHPSVNEQIKGGHWIQVRNSKIQNK